MSMPNIPDINPNINIVRDDAVNIIMASIAMEELALAHILNAEGEKLQYVLGTLEGRDPGEITICDIMEINNSVHKTLKDVIKEEMLLQLKLEDAIELAENASECQLTIRGQKTWRDGNNIANTRPASIQINLLRDGEVYKTVTVDSTGDGTYTFACLPVWRDSENRYTYQVDEVAPAGYTRTVSNYNITNTVEPGQVTISGTKTWMDNNNVTGDRPAQITVNLLQNGTQFLAAQVDSPATGNTAEFSFANVPQFDDQGVPFVYTVDEEDVTGYGKAINDMNITNTIEGVTTITGSKIWVNDTAADRPDQITVNLLQNGTQFLTTQVDSPETGSTAEFSFVNVPQFDAQGAEFVYTVEEPVVENYDTSITGFDITNTIQP